MGILTGRSPSLQAGLFGALAPVALPVLFLGLAGSMAAQERPSPEPAALRLGWAEAPSLDSLVRALPGHPTSLSELLATALRANQELEVARLQEQVSRAGLLTEQGIFDPVVQMGGELLGSDATGISGGRRGSWTTELGTLLPWGTELGAGLSLDRAPGLDASGEEPWMSSFRLGASQPLLQGRGVRDVRVRAARHLMAGAENDVRRVRDGVLAQVEILYWTLAEAEAVEAVRRRSLELAAALLARNEELAVRDLIPEVDVLTARSAVAIREALVTESRRERADAAEELLFVAFGTEVVGSLPEDGEPVKTTDVPSPFSHPTLAAALAEAASRRPDLASVRLRLAAAEELLRGSRNAVLPNLALDGGYEGVRQGGTGLASDGGWRVGLRFSTPIGNRGNRGTERDATWTRDLRSLEVSTLESVISLEVREALRRVRSGEERLRAAERAASLAGALLEAERRRLELGLADSFRLLQIEESVAEAELEAVRARYDLARGDTRLRLAVGAMYPPGD